MIDTVTCTADDCSCSMISDIAWVPQVKYEGLHATKLVRDAAVCRKCRTPDVQYARFNGVMTSIRRRFANPRPSRGNRHKVGTHGKCAVKHSA